MKQELPARCPHLKEVKHRRDLKKGVSTFHPDHLPNTRRPTRGIHQPFENYDTTRPHQLARGLATS